MREGERRIREGKNTREGTFLFWESIIFLGEDCIAGLGARVACWRMVLLVFS